MKAQPLGPVLHSYFADHLIAVKGLRPASVRSYRDTIRLLLAFTAAAKRRKITRLTLEDLTFEQVLAFLRHLEESRGNQIRTRNQRLAALHSFFEYIATRAPEMLAVCQQVAAIPAKRVPPPETFFLEREEVQALLARMPQRDGWRCATARSCCSPTTPGHASRKPPGSGPGTSTSASTRSPASTAKAANGEPAPCGSRQRARSPSCSPHMTRRQARSQRSSPRTGTR
jgi:Phage integrase, N-terminal SAM-like domain